jgi:hypothetical protein
MPILKVCTKYTYPESGTRNNRVYPQEVLEKAFEEYLFKKCCEQSFIPVKTADDEFLGYATAKLENGNTITIEADIWSGPYFDILKEMEDDSMGFILAGVGHTEIRDNKHVVIDVSFDRVELTSNPAVDYTTKIYRDDIVYPDRYHFAPWITDDFGYRRTLEQLVEKTEER